MVIDHHKVDLAFRLIPGWTQEPPKITVRLDQDILWYDQLAETRFFEFSRSFCLGVHVLEIELSDKSDLDPIQNISICDFSVGKIQSPRFVWQGIYRPCYPEPWASQQRALGVDLKDELYNTDHLGWNGTWSLKFSVPVFTWIHQVENLGWIYD